MTDKTPEPRVAVLIPCLNEEATVGRVVEDFIRVLPQAVVYVYDNGSTDATAERARRAGAVVKSEPRRGKGNVVRAMFREIEADVYVMADGDSTYPAEAAPRLIEPVVRGEADMAVGDRMSHDTYDAQNVRPMHGMGNRLVRGLINRLFRSRLADILSGYRAMNRFFVKNCPVLSRGFEVETEMTLHALDRGFRIREVPVDYLNRPPGSESKLKTVSDGLLVMGTIMRIFKNYRPLAFFGHLSWICALAGLLIGVFPVWEYFAYSYVYKVPSAVLAASLEILAVVLLVCGLILDTIVRQHRENYELALIRYLERGNGG